VVLFAASVLAACLPVAACYFADALFNWADQATTADDRLGPYGVTPREKVDRDGRGIKDEGGDFFQQTPRREPPWERDGDEYRWQYALTETAAEAGRGAGGGSGSAGRSPLVPHQRDDGRPSAGVGHMPRPPAVEVGRDIPLL